MIDYIPFKETGYFSQIITDYLSENQELRPLYNHFPSITNFKKQIEEKKNNYPVENRKILVNSIKKQYNNINLTEKIKNNIDLLENSNAFTITTGHQLSLFTGPLYFIYKIISVIKTCSILKAQYPENEFIPIYWMATEDHDFEEINHFYIHQKKVVWNSNQTGMVGAFKTETLLQVAEALKVELGISSEAKKIFELFKNAYLKNSDLSSATRYLVNELFKEYGLVIIDGNDKSLKQLFIPYFKQDLLENTAYNQVNKTISYIKKINTTYPIQVNPREINIFYLKKGIRERIIKQNNTFQIHNTSIQFSENELIKELEENPENFSPNVILRPVYQEVILPNLCYIGGGGELAYWLELKASFEAQKITFPILMLRNSVLIIYEKQFEKLKKLQVSKKDIFLKKNVLKNEITKKISEFPIDFSSQKELLKNQFEYLYKIAQQTDKTFHNAVKAQEVKQIKGLEKLEKRLLKAQKKKNSEYLERVLTLRSELFPEESLQERINNFSEYMIATQGNFINLLISTLNPFDFRFIIITLNN